MMLMELVWKQMELRRMKLSVYNTKMVPTLVHGSETWALNKQEESTAQVMV